MVGIFCFNFFSKHHSQQANPSFLESHLKRKQGDLSIWLMNFYVRPGVFEDFILLPGRKHFPRWNNGALGDFRGVRGSTRHCSWKWDDFLQVFEGFSSSPGGVSHSFFLSERYVIFVGTWSCSRCGKFSLFTSYSWKFWFFFFLKKNIIWNFVDLEVFSLICRRNMSEESSWFCFFDALTKVA